MIKLIVLDVDGCLTDGGIIYHSDGSESKRFNVKDGLAISAWIKMGNYAAIITGRSSSTVERRAKELGIVHLYQGVHNKDEVLEELLLSLGLRLDQVGAIGDDFNDYNMLQKVGRSFTPKDGAVEIRTLVQTQLSQKGGRGAVREMIDILIDENKQREAFLSLWY